MESAILKVLKKDKEAQEKLSVLENLEEKHKRSVEVKQQEIKEKIWNDAYQYVLEQKELLQAELEKGKTINKHQSEKLLQQLEDNFVIGKENWKEELIYKVIALEEESELL